MKRIFAVVLLCAMILSVFAAFGAAKQAEAGVVDGNTYPQENAVIENLGTGNEGVTTALDMEEGSFAAVTGYGSVPTLGATYDTYDGTITNKNYASTFDPLFNAMGEDKVLEISTAEQFVSFLWALNQTKSGTNPLTTDADKQSVPYYDFSDVKVRLTTNIEINAVDANGNLTQKRAMPEIAGNLTRYFIGTFDGDGHVVSGWYQKATSNNRSMFGPLYGATIKNVAFINCYMDAYYETDEKASKGPQKTSSVLSVFAYGTCNIENVYVGAKHDGGKANLGGLIGNVQSNATLNVKNTSVDITYGVEGHNPAEKNIGGMIGTVASSAKVSIENCTVDCNLTADNAATVSTSSEIEGQTTSAGRKMYLATEFDYSNALGYGGVIGTCNGTLTVNGCKATGSLSAVGTGVGGVVGYMNSANASSFTNVQNEVSLTALDTIYVPFAIASDAKAYYINKGTDDAPEYVPAYVENMKATATCDGFGGVIGLVKNKGAITFVNVLNKGAIEGGRDYVGGILGGIKSTPTITFGSKDATTFSCVNKGTVKGSGSHIGGIVGGAPNSNNTTLNFYKCLNDTDATVQGKYNVGGMLGHLQVTTPLVLEYCLNKADITASAYHVGGLIGDRQGGATTDMIGCVNTGAVTAQANTSIAKQDTLCGAGGLIGYKGNTGDFTVTNCINTGAVKATDGYVPVGGLVGWLQQGKLIASGFYNKGNVTSKYWKAGGMIGHANGAAANTISITDCHNTSDATIKGSQYVGGLVGYKQDACPLIITDSSNAGTIQATDEEASCAGGILGYQTGTGAVTIGSLDEGKGVVNSGMVTGAKYIGGIIGSLEGQGTTTLEQCVNQVDITGTGYAVAGMVGNAFTTNALYGSLEILGCKNTGNIKGLGQLGGAVGIVVIDSVKIDGFINSGDVTRSTETVNSEVGSWVGGIGGYIRGEDGVNLTDTVSITNCKNTGTITGNRCTGGLVGMAQHIAVLTVANCYSMGDIDAHVTDTSNPYIGGLLGAIAETGTATVNGNAFGGNLTVNTNIKATEAVTVYAGGLVGGLRRLAKTVTVDSKNISLYVQEGCDEKWDEFLFCNNTIKMDGITTGTLNWNTDQPTETTTYVAGAVARDVYCGINNSASYIRPDYKMNNLVSESGNRPNGMTIKTETNDANINNYTKRMIMRIGAQYGVNAGADGQKGTEDDTYNLRYIFAVDGLQDDDKALGFVVTRNTFKNKEGNFDGSATPVASTKTLYCPNVYKTLKGETEIYNAEDYGADYFFTLELQEIPAKYLELVNGRYMLKDTDLRIFPFVNSGKLEDDNPKSATAYIGHTDSISWEKRISYYQNDFSKNPPDQFFTTETDEEGTKTFVLKDGVQSLIPDIRWHNDVFADAEAGTEKAYDCVTATKKDNLKILLEDGCTNGEHSCTPFEAHSVSAELETYSSTVIGTSARYHYYVKTNLGATANRQTAYFRVAVNTSELNGPGLYDFCFQLSLGNNKLHSIRVQVNNQAYHEQTILTYDVAQYQGVVTSYPTNADDAAKDATFHDSYLTGFSAELGAGVNYITFRMPYVHSDFEVAADTWHIRNIFVKPAATPAE